MIEGDFEFLIDSINLFEKFYEFKESGNFISMKLRMFFKKFLIPRKLNKDDEDIFMEELKRKETRYHQRYLKEIKGEKAVKKSETHLDE